MRLLAGLPTWRGFDGGVHFPSIILSTLVALSLGWRVWAEPVQGQISRSGDATHVEFLGRAKWNYELTKVGPKVYELTVPQLDDKSIAGLQTWNDQLVSQIKVLPPGTDGQQKIVFSLPDDSVETFHYLTEQPSRLIVDFFRIPKVEAKSVGATSGTEAPATAASGEPTKGKKSRVQKLTKSLPVKDAEGYAQKARGGGRSPAGDELISGPTEGDRVGERQASGPAGLIFDAADPDYQRFRLKDYKVKPEAVIASRQNIYIRFPALKMPFSIVPELLKNPPEFEIRPQETRENKQARLLLELYRKQIAGDFRVKDRMGAFLKAYENFTKEFPSSDYSEIVHNLAAMMHYLRWQRDGDVRDYETTQKLLKRLTIDYPNSVLTERNQEWLTFNLVDRGDHLGAIQEIQEFLRLHPNSPRAPKLRTALAEAYTELSKFADAKNEFRNLESSAASAAVKEEAAYRLGDVAMAEKNWAEAEATYKRALKEFAAGQNVFPNAYFNLAEAQFWQKNYSDALSNYVNFVSKFPDHFHGGYALTRIGETLDALGADRSQVIGAYLESYFRFRQHPGSDVARVRMLSQQLQGMKEKEKRKALEEMREIAKNSPLPTMSEFVTLMVADGYQRRGENVAALKELIDYYQRNPNTATLALFRARVLRNVAENLQSQVGQGQFMDALNFHAEYAKNWLKNSDRLDIGYFVAKAYEQAGALEEAKRLYSDLLGRRKQIVGTESERERKVAELLPSVESLSLRVAAVAAADRRYPEAFAALKSIASDTGLSEAESAERIGLMAEIAQARGDHKQAVEYLKRFISSWKGDPTWLRENQLRLGRLYLVTGAPAESEKVIDQVLAVPNGGDPLPDAQLAAALEIKGDAQRAQDKDLAAVETYESLLDKYEATMPLASVRYRIGDIFFRRGDLAGAEKAWQGIDAAKNAVFRRLADERLAGARWDAEYKKYIRRIPAMATSGKEQ